jgi:hypothetical protein
MRRSWAGSSRYLLRNQTKPRRRPVPWLLGIPTVLPFMRRRTEVEGFVQSHRTPRDRRPSGDPTCIGEFGSVWQCRFSCWQQGMTSKRPLGRAAAAGARTAAAGARTAAAGARAAAAGARTAAAGTRPAAAVVSLGLAHQAEQSGSATKAAVKYGQAREAETKLHEPSPCVISLHAHAIRSGHANARCRKSRTRC